MNETTASAPPGILSSTAQRLRDIFAYRPILVLFVTGLVLRVTLMITYFPAVMMCYDSPRYARIDSIPLFGDFWMPAGYPMLLKLLHVVSHRFWFTIAVQHAMGITIGLVLFLVVRHVGLKPWCACLPAGVIFLSGDQLYHEHIMMADWFLMFLSVTGLAASLRGLVPQLNLRWLPLGSALVAAAALTRSVGVVLLPILSICTIVWTRNQSSHRAKTIAAAILPGLAVFGLYFGAFKLSHGQYLGLSDMRGWNLYSRVAPFADCQKFNPPEGTAILCEQRAPADRPGPFGYVWDLTSVPRVSFELGPVTGRKLGAFAKEAILHQPLDYGCAVLIDVAKYTDSSINPRPYSGQTPESLSFGFRDKNVEQIVVRALSREYRGTTVRLHGQNFLARYQSIFRISGLSIVALAVLSLFGMLRANGPVRLAVFLFGLAAFALYLLPVMTVSYDYRYGIPPGILLVVSGVLGVGSIWSYPRSASPTMEAVAD